MNIQGRWLNVGAKGPARPRTRVQWTFVGFFAKIAVECRGTLSRKLVKNPQKRHFQGVFRRFFNKKFRFFQSPVSFDKTAQTGNSRFWKYEGWFCSSKLPQAPKRRPTFQSTQKTPRSPPPSCETPVSLKQWPKMPPSLSLALTPFNHFLLLQLEGIHHTRTHQNCDLQSDHQIYETKCCFNTEFLCCSCCANMSPPKLESLLDTNGSNVFFSDFMGYLLVTLDGWRWVCCNASHVESGLGRLAGVSADVGAFPPNLFGSDRFCPVLISQPSWLWGRHLCLPAVKERWVW